ncbi:uncharacterized protein LOC109860878 [Pseudomyrmex gracilis]|uniref:uncharacterized protein LOC109860878 n=1 Tax=Pseudomyrmex gracilis TaxID=219809 RepID=UPI000994A8D0|nr:uncharacterized protein LOC109860878 [Pseudomyrmex gracilis]
MEGSNNFTYQSASCCKDKIANNADYEWAVKLNRYSLNLIGLWPTSRQTQRDNLICNLLIDNMQITLPIIWAVLKLVIFWWKKPDVKLLIDIIAYDWMKTKTSHERMIMISRAQTARIILICGYSMFAMGLLAVNVLPIFGYSVRYVTNITDPGRLLPLQTIPYSSIDNFLSLSIFHISGQLDILENQLANLNNNTNYVVILKNCITDHVRLLRAITIIEDIFNVILFMVFIYFGMIFVIQGVYMMSCGRIHDAAYCNEWYSLQFKDMRNLILVMAKTNKSLYLTAGKVFPLTMSTFCNLLKTCAGYISVLFTTRNL